MSPTANSPVPFGFLAHAATTGHRNQVRALDLFGRLLDGHTGTAREPGGRRSVRMPLITSVTSPTGARCTGEVRSLPYTAGQLIGRPATARELVAAEAARLRDAGAQLIGLGGATSIVGDRGVWTAGQVGTAVTSGNCLTAYAAHHQLRHVVRLLELRPEETRVAVVGHPGSIALAVAKLLLADGFELDLVCRRGKRAPAALLAHLAAEDHGRVRLVDHLDQLTPKTRLFVSASSVGGLVDPDRLPPGSVVVDVALPRDVTAPPRDAGEVLVIDGGLVSGCARVVIGDGGLPGPTRQLNGCLAETLVLALEGRAESFSLGRELPLERVRTIGDLAARHGFTPLPLASFGRTVPDEEVLRLARHHRPATRAASATAVTRRRFTEHVNPPMARLFGAHGLDRVFTGGRGCTLIAEDGSEHLDFVAGYGSLNLGHNHPVVTGRLREFLDRGSPSFVQYVSLPEQTAELAERLSALAPGRPERVYFGSSGAEAVEAALKLARAATGRSRLVHTGNGFHGKTFGALSVTGRDRLRAPFGPLLPDTVAVPYGDLEALETVIEKAAAFVVEPVQGEGGVVLPPPGYLTAARELCRRAGAVFVLDEIQTGLGRTGRLFAAEHDGLEPDVICLAKSLSGGLVPLSATLCRADVWDAAYGGTERALLHSSTFGGGNFAATAGLATLDVLGAERLPEHAHEVGEHLRASLRKACAPYGFVKDIRGTGLMTAVEFDGDFSGAVSSLADELLTRLPGDLRTLADWLPDGLRAALARAGEAVESTLGDLLCLRFVAALARDHRILTFVTANRTRVLRVQPPLVLSRAEADRFVEGVEAVCHDLALHADLDAWRPSTH
ncbi:aminotransferase class III-fold pyridoxal phosphate-dependent enzyme [Streptomyces viridochromogenes]|uniref:Putative Amino transferase n=1 Tax=Streptomyces viridochromogenes Tue57 TaxID=1160705 RepID=L8P7G4_STRVR|nr:aminotransferase class III-fold pyridoxal phosphate-dependent enzyme [Streptomyces viridochromogenes]ELS51207.1 putative Amino transferase [Streptomyces viridochromogenes Tue57]